MSIISSESRLPPLFTTVPLTQPFGCQYTASPISARPYSPTPRYRSQSTTPSEPLSRSNSSPLEHDQLTFAKVPIPSSQSCGPSYQSTDSETVSSDWDLSSRQGYGGSRSPSLLTCLIQARPQPPRLSSTSNSSCQPTPVTPHSTATATTFFRGYDCAKPILRRSSASAYTSASEDGMSTQISGLALNLGCGLDKVAESIERVGKPLRACTLKFAVNPCASADRVTSNPNSRSSSSSHTSRHGQRRSDNSFPVWEDEEEEADDDDEDDDEEDDSPFLEAESESDEGYQEDEEDGFTSDEEATTSSAGPSRRPSQVYSKQIAWAESSNWASGFTMVSGVTTNRKRRQSPSYVAPGLSEEEFTDLRGDEAVSPRSAITRGRQVRVKDVIGRNGSGCTRHRSPPPKSLSPAPAPPAARSPSAAELCRRRTCGIMSPIPGIHNSKGWRSDDPACATYQGAASVHRQVSLALPKTCAPPILRRTPTAPSRCLPNTSPSSPAASEQRRTSEPEILRRGSLPISVLLSDSVANGQVVCLGSGRDGAKAELERALRINIPGAA